MDKMAQWKSSILGINKSSHGGPVKGKMPMSAPMAKYANGGRVVKMQEGGSMKEMAKKYASKAIEGVKNASASVKSAASRATTRPKDMSGTIDKVEAAIRSASGRAFTVPKSVIGAVNRATTLPKTVTKIIAESYGDNGPDEPAKATPAPSASTKSVSTSSVPTKSSEGPSDYGDGTASAKGKSSFGRAFRAARKAMENGTGGKTFTWNGESYSTRKAEESIKDFNAKKYAKGGKVMADGGAADMKQDKAMIARHNRLMHSGQKSKLMNGGMVNKYADGNAVKKDPYASDKTQGLGMMTDKEAENASMKIAKKYPPKKSGMIKKGDGGAMRVQGNMKRPQFSASKSFDGGKTRIGMSAGKGNFRASFSKKFADGGAVTRLANEASGVISDMTKNRAMMKKGGSVKKGSMMKSKGSMMKAMSNKR